MTTEAIAKRRLDALLKDKARILGELDAKISDLQDKKYSESAIEKLRERRATIDGSYTRIISLAQEAVDKAVIAESRKAESDTKVLADKARAAEEALKRQTRLSYISHGGSPDSFEEAWPALRDRLISEKVSQDIEKSSSPGFTL